MRNKIIVAENLLWFQRRLQTLSSTLSGRYKGEEVGKLGGLTQRKASKWLDEIAATEGSGVF